MNYERAKAEDKARLRHVFKHKHRSYLYPGLADCHHDFNPYIVNHVWVTPLPPQRLYKCSLCRAQLVT